MTITECILYFGGEKEFLKIANVYPSYLATWKREGFIPINKQVEIEKSTGGGLKASLRHIKKPSLRGSTES
jgi:hypothetical protein